MCHVISSHSNSNVKLCTICKIGIVSQFTQNSLSPFDSRFDCLAGCVNVELINIAESHYMPDACVSMEFIIALWVGLGVQRKSHYPNEPNIILINDQYRLLSWFKDHFDLPYVVDYRLVYTISTPDSMWHTVSHLPLTHSPTLVTFRWHGNKSLKCQVVSFHACIN